MLRIVIIETVLAPASILVQGFKNEGQATGNCNIYRSQATGSRTNIDVDTAAIAEQSCSCTNKLALLFLHK